MVFYAVANGREIGIFSNWNDCNASVKNYKNAAFKKFNTREEADEFIQQYTTALAAKTVISDKSHMETIELFVYTDGSCSKNGRKNACAGIGIYFGTNDPRNVSKRIEGKQTNNTAELSAIIETYKIIENEIASGKKIAIMTDSEYAMKCVGSYGEKCCKKNWDKEIPNIGLIQQIYEMYKDKPNVEFIHVKAHTNNTDIHSVGNWNADLLANMAVGLHASIA